MVKVRCVLAAVGILSAATLAFGADKTYTTTGKVKSIDLMRHVVTLENGSAYKVARGVNIRQMKIGEKVTLTYSGFGGTIEASAIKPAAD
jgi:hypothetical protein